MADQNDIGDKGIIAGCVYMLILPCVLIHLIVVLWPSPTSDELWAQSVSKLNKAAESIARKPTSQKADAESLKQAQQAAKEITEAADKLSKMSPAQEWSDVKFFGFVTITISAEIRMLLLVLALGGVGSYVHMAASFVDFAGNRQLKWSWAPWYIVRPAVGGALALLFYFAIRAGFMTAQSTASGDVNR